MDITNYGASVTQFRYCIALEGPAMTQEVTEWVIHPRKSDHAVWRSLYLR